jgi:hypothetical protein
MSTDIRQLDSIEQWTPFEVVLHSAHTHANPYADVDVQVHFIRPSGQTITRDAFWDGEGVWRARISPGESGLWRWRTLCNLTGDAGLHGIEGQFECVPYAGDNPLYKHGALRLSANRRYFEHADGTPFFWLGDTCWNGVLRAKPADWDDYLTTRKQQGFNVIQYISTHWRALSKDPFGETAFAAGDRDRINPAFFQRMDPRVSAINQHGCVAAPILVHDNGSEGTDGNLAATMSEAQTIRLARYLLARWGAYHAAFTLGGDGRYDTEGTARWQRIGRAVFGDQPHLLATMHPCGVNWMNDTLNNEAWLNFVVYQSGHYGSPDEIRWLSHGAPSHEWQRPPFRPFINAEPNYEAHAPFRFRFPVLVLTEPFTECDVRRAAYWSLLVAPTAGTSYGHQYIWPWNEQAAEPEGHDELGYGVLPPWREGLHSPGARSMRVLRALFDGLPWWTLRPAPEVVLNQTDSASNPLPFIAVARSEDGSLAVIYMPIGGELRLDPALLPPGGQARWFDPRTGATTDAATTRERDALVTAPPDTQDWVLWIDANRTT